jgi:hypothetical protein
MASSLSRSVPLSETVAMDRRMLSPVDYVLPCASPASLRAMLQRCTSLGPS